mmetsp:Transcript_32270/g.72803  ORF Transcript_32270/g.72803 Transcript_32270/m.72803 type:complete len:188 (+) Transcript_32270:666-1229(+)
MSILGWIALGAALVVVVYLWYMCFCFWHLLRIASVSTRRVLQAIKALPCKQYHPDAAAAEDSTDPGSCAICLSDFEEGELVRTLPCAHDFCKPCIDSWIKRQGMAASCPLCKRAIVSRDPQVVNANEDVEEASTDTVEGDSGGTATGTRHVRQSRLRPLRSGDALLAPAAEERPQHEALLQASSSVQ